MKKKYKNEIFQALLNHPLGVDNFEISENGKGYDLRITYLPFDGTFHFDFDQSGDSFDYFIPFAVLYVPGLASEQLSEGEVLFKSALEAFKIWLDEDITEYINDQNTVDLYEEYKKNTIDKNLQQLDYQNHSGFTIVEKEQIRIGINELKLIMLDKFAGDDTEKQIITERLDYLTETIDRIENKTDWKGIYINTFLTICIALTLDTQRGKELWQLFMNVLNIVPFLP